MGSNVYDIHDYGTKLDDKKLKCNYCDHVQTGVTRLRDHLAGKRGDVSPCPSVPQEVKEAFYRQIIERQNRRGSQVVGLRVASKRCRSDGKANNDNKVAAEPLVERKRERTRNMVSSPHNKRLLISEPSAKTAPAEDSLSFEVKRSTAEDEVKEVKDYVEMVKRSWASTGCSIVLDGWSDEHGRNLLSIIVDCPKGAIYLRSIDVSAAIGNTDSLQLLLEKVLEEVGEENVVQIVTYSTSEVMEYVGKQLIDRHRNLFWSVSATHCIELMLERMAELDLVKGVVVKAKIITKLIYSRAFLRKLMTSYTGSSDLVVSSKVKSATPFLTLDNIVCEEDNLKSMFSSSVWASSVWASSLEGERVAKLVLTDHSFWNAARVVARATMPIVTVIKLIHQDDKPLVGYIYKTLDQAKEKIQKDLEYNEDEYMPFWVIIDSIWNNKLHSPLHAAGYLLNPIYYNPSSISDEPEESAEVLFGLLCCIFRLTQSEQIIELIYNQLEAYEKGNIRRVKGSDPSSSPDIWWASHGGKCPELQRLAMKILSQTCDGAVRYQLKRDFAENMLSDMVRKNRKEQKRLEDLAFVYYNMQLKNFQPGGSTIIAGAEETNPMNDWIIYNAGEACTAAAEDQMLTTNLVASTSTQQVEPQKNSDLQS